MGRSSDLPNRLSIVLVSFLFFFFCVSCNGLSGDRKPNSASSDRSLMSSQRRRDQRIFNCGEKVSALQCSQSPNCRWCRSEVIDDTCFTRTEALRLPQQVFSCDWNSSLYLIFIVFCCFSAVGHGFTSYLLIFMAARVRSFLQTLGLPNFERSI